MLVDLWAEQKGDADTADVHVDFQDAMQRLTLDIIGKGAFGYSFGATTGGGDKIAAAYAAIFANASLPQILLRSLPGFARLLRCIGVNQADLAEIRDLVKQIIHEKQCGTAGSRRTA